LAAFFILSRFYNLSTSRISISLYFDVTLKIKNRNRTTTMSSVFDAQNHILKQFLKYAKNTAYGRHYGFKDISDYKEFVNQVPVSTFKDYAPYLDQIKQGVPDLIWPGTANKFAISAGTTGKPKEIPLTDDRKRSDVTFLRKVALGYLKQNPWKVFKIAGPHASLPGMIENDPEFPGVTFGEISGFLATFAPPILAKLQILPADEAVRMNFEDKVELMIERAIKSDVRVFTSLPSVALRFYQILLERTGKKSIAEIWPNLQLMISGGEPLPSYKEHLKKLSQGIDVHYIENYGASEGYFSFNVDQDRDDMKLVVNNNVFYEWIPDPSANKDELVHQKTIPTWEVETGKRYAMVVTSNSGLWRYLLNDVIVFTDLETPRIKVSGRVTDVHDAYGEAIEAFHVKETLDAVVKETGGVFSNYSLGVLLDDTHPSPTHIWFIEWAEKPRDFEVFKQKVDETLISINRSYEIRRKGKAIAIPEFYSLSKDAIEKWQNEFFNVRAQTKIPRMIHEQAKCRGLIKYSQKE